MAIISSLVQGMESEENIKLLISLTDMTSELMERALIMHYVHGAPSKHICDGLGIAKGNFTRDSKRINAVASKIDKYNETAHAHFSSKIAKIKAEVVSIESKKSIEWNVPKNKLKGLACKN